MMPSLAQRLGAVEPSGRIEFGRYLALVQAKRTTANGVFGTKLLAAQLKRLSGGKVDIAAGLMGRWDKIVLLRRRDTLMQAISLVRSLINGQWHLIGDDRMAPIDCADEILFGRITHCWAQVIDEDRYMQAVIARLDPQRMWAAWYEDLGDERVRQALAQWLGDKTGGAALPPPTENPWPKKADAAEAEAMRRRYLAYIGALGMAPAG
jgi:LPS sulfotransferase NodH